MQNQLLLVLKSLSNKINKRYEYVNCGGCAIVACALAHKLSECEGVSDAQVVAERWDEEHFDASNVKNNKGFNNTWGYWKEHGVTNGHILVMFTYKNIEYLVDTDEIIPFKEYNRMLSLNLPVKEMKALADDPHYWNPTFNRNQIRGLRCMITRTLNQA